MAEEAEAGPRQEGAGETQETAWPDLPSLHVGMIIDGVVAAVDDERVLIDVGGKSEGVLTPREAVLERGQHLTGAFHPGDTVSVMIVGFDPEQGGPILSQKRAKEAQSWTDLSNAFSSGEVLEAPVFEEVRGGLLVDVGVRAFMPASHVERGYVPDLSGYVGKNVRVRIIELDRDKGRVIVSQRVVLEQEQRARKEQTWAALAEGQVRQGIVKGLTSFGAFVDLGGVDGLLHVSAMSWSHVPQPSERLHVGQEVTVKILRLDREHNRISLGLKQLEPDPWATVPDRFPVGETVEGMVVRLAPFGAFVEVEPGIEGLVHISQMATHHVREPGEVVQPGQRVRVKVLRVSATERRIGLSMRQADGSSETAPSAPAEAQPEPPGSGGATIGERLGSEWPQGSSDKASGG